MRFETALPTLLEAALGTPVPGWERVGLDGAAVPSERIVVLLGGPGFGAQIASSPPGMAQLGNEIVMTNVDGHCVVPFAVAEAIVSSLGIPCAIWLEGDPPLTPLTALDSAGVAVPEAYRGYAEIAPCVPFPLADDRAEIEWRCEPTEAGVEASFTILETIGGGADVPDRYRVLCKGALELTAPSSGDPAAIRSKRMYLAFSPEVAADDGADDGADASTACFAAGDVLVPELTDARLVPDLAWLGAAFQAGLV